MTARREDALDIRLPDPVVTYGDESDPEAEALLADSVGLALHKSRWSVFAAVTSAHRAAKGSHFLVIHCPAADTRSGPEPVPGSSFLFHPGLPGPLAAHGGWALPGVQESVACLRVGRFGA